MAKPESNVYEVALNHYEQLLLLIPVDEVARKLLSKQIIDLNDKQLINAEKSDKKRAEYLLDHYILKRVESGEHNVFYILLEAMNESGKCDSLVKKIYKDLGKSPPSTGKLFKLHCILWFVCAVCSVHTYARVCV